VQETLVELDEVDVTWDRVCSSEFQSQDREKEIQTQLCLEHLIWRKGSYWFKHV